MQILYIQNRLAIIIASCILVLVVLLVGMSIDKPNQVVSGDDIIQPYYSGNDDSMVSLAINVDWGEEYIPRMLQIFADEDIKVTFFLTGRWCDNNPELAREIVEAGHEIGNHGYSHSSPNGSNKEEIIEEIKKTEYAIEEATGIKTVLYAPPSGECESHVIEASDEVGYSMILWSVDTIDWQKPSAATIIERVTSKIHGGAIILAHPTESTADALETLIIEIKEEGYTFANISENIGL